MANIFLAESHAYAQKIRTQLEKNAVDSSVNKAREAEEKKQELKKLVFGDKVLLTDKSEAIFLKLNRTKFVGLIDEKRYDIPIRMFVKKTGKVKRDPKLDAKIAEARKYSGKTVQTSYGPSDVKAISEGITSADTLVELLEFGEEYYTLNIDNFLDEMKEWGR